MVVACIRVMTPALTKPTTITEVAVELWMMAVTPAPIPTPEKRLLLILPSSFSMPSPALFPRASPIKFIPTIKTSTPASNQIRLFRSYIPFPSIVFSFRNFPFCYLPGYIPTNYTIHDFRQRISKFASNRLCFFHKKSPYPFSGYGDFAISTYLMRVMLLKRLTRVLATEDIILMKISKATPTTSFLVSPTVSPVTAAL